MSSSTPPKPQTTTAKLPVGEYASTSLSRTLNQTLNTASTTTLPSLLPLLQSNLCLSTVLKTLGYGVPSGGEGMDMLGYMSTGDEGFNRRINTEVKTALKKKVRRAGHRTNDSTQP